MSDATLVYTIGNGKNSKNLKLISESLFNLDKYTCNFKNEDDFINHYKFKEKIDDFIRENGKLGHVVINYSKSVTEKEQILPLFDSKDIFIFKDDPYEGKVTEIEKARRLLFNSKNQLFMKLILSLKMLDKVLYNMVDLDDREAEYAIRFGYKLIYINNQYYMNFKSLFDYRLRVDKLGILRRAYEEMLRCLKEKIIHLDSNTYYYYSRQLRIAINTYKNLVTEVFIDNFKIRKMSNKKYKLVKISL